MTGPHRSRAWRWMVLAALLIGAGGCGTLQTVQPWQKGYLARSEMGFEGDHLDKAYTEHTYFSKEAASGSGSVAGGGCGCN